MPAGKVGEIGSDGSVGHGSAHCVAQRAGGGGKDLFAGGDDVIALVAGSSVVALRTLLRILVFVVPAFTGAVAYALCLRVKAKRSAQKGRALRAPEEKTAAYPMWGAPDADLLIIRNIKRQDGFGSNPRGIVRREAR